MLSELQKKVTKYMEKYWYWGFCLVAIVAFSYGMGWFLNWVTDDFDLTPFDQED